MGLLPTVQSDICGVMEKEILEDPGYMIKLAEEIGAENPLIIEFLYVFIMNQRITEVAKKFALHAGLLVYKMLKNQAEADKLRELER